MTQVVHTSLHNGWVAKDWYRSKTLLLVSVPAILAVVEKGVNEHWPWYQFVLGIALAMAPSTLRDTLMRGVNILAAYQAAVSQTINNQVEVAATNITNTAREIDNNENSRHANLIATVNNQTKDTAPSKEISKAASGSRPKKHLSRPAEEFITSPVEKES